jgi:adenine-specific DNA-methyltransferase
LLELYYDFNEPYTKKILQEVSKTDNLIIHGDNKFYFKFKVTNFFGKVKCIYIDPPYINGEKYHHYNGKETMTIG